MEYKKWLYNRLNELKHDLSLNDFSIVVSSEREFVKHAHLSENVIHVVCKKLKGNKMFAATVQPIEIMIMSEGNGFTASQILFSKFFQDYNWFSHKEETTTYKHQYSNPVVIDNFNIVGVGQRSILYISATLYILENVVDISNFKVDSESLNLINATIAYTMGGDSEPFPNTNFTKTVKSIQSLQLSITTPCVSSTFFTNAIKILNDTENGNKAFSVSFSLGSTALTLSMRINSLTFSTAPNQTPSLVVVFTL